MSHLRFDMATNDWVVFAPSRALRPKDAGNRGQPPPSGQGPANCPFCPGNEAFTPPEIYAVRSPEKPGKSNWKVRVFPNKFPALRIEEDPTHSEDAQHMPSMGGCGAHEVIVESPQHDTFLGQQPAEQVELVLGTLQLRYRDLMRDRRFQTVILFKNHGLGAGTSLQHPHWQLIATPVVPRLLRVQHIEAEEYFDRHGACLFCVMLERELAAETRLVSANQDYVAFLPFASHVPFETWIMPRRPQPSFMLVEPKQMSSLAEIQKTALLKLYTGLGNPDFNLTIDDVPRGDEDKEYFRWHMRILPRLSTPAGFELGSGMSINTVLPEEAAAFLREVPVACEGVRQAASPLANTA
ncbi:MAG: galactose-1-phosphate uridylyltransferase [Pirellulales bacterium]